MSNVVLDLVLAWLVAAVSLRKTWPEAVATLRQAWPKVVLDLKSRSGGDTEAGVTRDSFDPDT